MDAEAEAVEGSREAIIDGFHRAPGQAILIANPQAVGESISLHKACRTAIYFDRAFNAGRYIQSKDRIHRYNPKGGDRKSTRLNSSHYCATRMPSSERKKKIKSKHIME